MKLKRFTTVATLIVVLSFMANTPAQPEDTTSQAKKRETMTLEVNLKRQTGGRGYRKPYVASWIEDNDGFPVRTISLWVQKRNPGPRWIPDLKQWYRADRMRGLVDETDLVDGVSGATRPAGKYKMAWDGLDGQGNPLPQGEYTLLVEIAREHGTYQIAKLPFAHGPAAFEKSLPGNPEWDSVTVEYAGRSE